MRTVRSLRVRGAEKIVLLEGSRCLGRGCGVMWFERQWNGGLGISERRSGRSSMIVNRGYRVYVKFVLGLESEGEINMVSSVMKAYDVKRRGTSMKWV